MKKTLIDLFPYLCNPNPLIRTRKTVEEVEHYLSDFLGKDAVLLASARVGIYEALRFFKLSRQNHILVPDFLCQSILNILHKSSFPVISPDDRLKAVLLFHQWGYPQDMDKVLEEAKKRKLLIIENCAHGIDSKYKGRNIGTFGDLAVWSVSKMFNTYMGGVLSSDNRALIDFVKKDRQAKKNIKNWLFNRLAFWTARDGFHHSSGPFILDAVYLKSIHFPNIDRRALKLFPADKFEFEKLLQKRKENYKFLVKNINQKFLIPDLDSSIDVNPFAIPVFLPEEKLEGAVLKFEEIGVKAEILHFDINRNVFNQKYLKCLALPCHQNIEESKLSEIVGIINHL